GIPPVTVSWAERRRAPVFTVSLLDRLLSTEIGLSFGFALGFFTTLLVMNHVFYLARLAINQGLPFGVALELFVYKVPYLVAFSDFAAGAAALRPVQNIFFQGPSPEGSALYHAQRYNPQTQTLEGVTVVYLVRGQEVRLVRAREATYREGGAWTFHDGTIYVF